MRAFVPVILLFLAVSGVLASQKTEGNITLQNPIQLRSKPLSGAPVITVLEEGQTIFLEREKNDWYKISFSAELNLWVSFYFLKNGAFTESVIFRTKPTAGSSNVSVIGNMAGKKADIIESESNENWKKIRLRSEFYGYISKNDLEKGLKKKENRHFIHHKPIISTAVGRLLPLEKPVKNATHKLIYRVYETEYLVAYIVPDKVNLKLWENWMIYLSGERTWHPSVFTPFMKGANIFPAYR